MAAGLGPRRPSPDFRMGSVLQDVLPRQLLAPAGWWHASCPSFVPRCHSSWDPTGARCPRVRGPELLLARCQQTPWPWGKQGMEQQGPSLPRCDSRVPSSPSPLNRGLGMLWGVEGKVRAEDASPVLLPWHKGPTRTGPEAPGAFEGFEASRDIFYLIYSLWCWEQRDRAAEVLRVGWGRSRSIPAIIWGGGTEPIRRGPCFCILSNSERQQLGPCPQLSSCPEEERGEMGRALVWLWPLHRPL